MNAPRPLGPQRLRASSASLAVSGENTSARDPEGAPRLVAVGEILGAHGIKGGLWVRPFSPEPGRERALGDVLLVKGAEAVPARVTAARAVEGRWTLVLEGVGTREEAEGLAGWTVAVPEADAPALPDGTFYVHDLVGRRVTAEDGRDLGELTGVLSTGGNDVYQIEGPDGELLFPALRALVLDCPKQSRTMRVRVPPGLLEACLSKRR